MNDKINQMNEELKKTKDRKFFGIFEFLFCFVFFTNMICANNRNRHL